MIKAPQPKQIDSFFVWQCAFSGALAYPHILPCYLWEILGYYDKVEKSSLYKFYQTEADAIQALKAAIRTIDNSLDDYRV